MSGKYSRKLLNPAKKSAADVLKTASKRAVEKNRCSIWWFFDNKITGNITRTDLKATLVIPIETKYATENSLETQKYIYMPPRKR